MKINIKKFVKDVLKDVTCILFLSVLAITEIYLLGGANILIALK